MGELRTVTVTTISAAIVFGMVITLLGSIKLALAERLKIKEDRIGLLLSALTLAMIPMTLLGGVLIDAWGPRGILVLGSLLSAVALVTLTFSERFSGTLGAILLAGLGGACLSAGSVVLMPHAFFEESAHLTAALNLGNVFIGLGALVTPTLAGLFLGPLGFNRTMQLLAVICLVPAVAAIITPGDQMHVLSPQEPEATDWRLWLIGLVFFLYAPIEFACNTWATTYLTELGYRPRPAEFLLSTFWLVFLASRLGVGLLGHAGFLPQAGDPWLVILLGLVAAVTLGNVAGAPAQKGGGFGLLLVAAALGPIFPTLIGIAFRIFPEPQRGTVFGAVFAMGSTGALLVAPLFGLVARRNGVRVTLHLLVVLALGVAATGLLLALMLPAKAHRPEIKGESSHSQPLRPASSAITSQWPAAGRAFQA